MKNTKKATVLKNVPYGKVCQYKEFNGRTIADCGSEPFGKIGNSFICKDHFDYALAMKGIHKIEVLDERKEDKKYVG